MQYTRDRLLSARYARQRQRRMEATWWRFCEAAVLAGRERADRLLLIEEPLSRVNVVYWAMRSGGVPGFRFLSGLEAADYHWEDFEPAPPADRHSFPQGRQRVSVLAARAARGEQLFDEETWWEEEEGGGRRAEGGGRRAESKTPRDCVPGEAEDGPGLTTDN